MQDTLISRSTLELILPKVTTVQSTYGDRLKKIKESVLVSAVNARFKAQDLRVSLSDNWYLSDKDHLVFSIDGEHGTEIKEKNRGGREYIETKFANKDFVNRNWLG